MNTKPAFHGSDIEKICEYYQLKKEDVINFAANVNPLGLSESLKETLAARLDILCAYPDRGYTGLRNVISDYCHIPPEFVLPGNGTSELISLLIGGCAPKRTLILGPTYSEYSRELSFSGSAQEYYHLKEDHDFILDVDDLCTALKNSGHDFLILCNPNNPTSSAILHDDMEQLLAFCAKNKIFVMIDETYVEFAPDITAVTAVPFTKTFSNLCVLRGVSKFFAAPGMRLGYAVSGNRQLLDKMKEKQIPWSLNSLGAFAGELLFQDKNYIEQTRQLILSERSRMHDILSQVPSFKVYPAYANFLLLQILKQEKTASDVFETCIKHGLMIRDCSSFQCLDGEFVRFCIMKPEDNSRLLKALKEI